MQGKKRAVNRLQAGVTHHSSLILSITINLSPSFHSPPSSPPSPPSRRRYSHVSHSVALRLPTASTTSTSLLQRTDSIGEMGVG